MTTIREKLLQEGYEISLGKDTNGNKIVKFKSDGGSFSIQTNGNLKNTHSADKDSFDKSDALKELTAYVKAHGTPAQKKAVSSVKF